jgi:cobalamin biosynthesis Mg chelatase CobN
MGSPQEWPDSPADGRIDNDEEDFGTDTVLTTAADVESAGRSCMAILVLMLVILLLLFIWIGFRALGMGQ